MLGSRSQWRRLRRPVLAVLAGSLIVSASLALGAAPHKKKFSAKPPKGAVVLFNGKDTSKWVRAGSDRPISWKVENGAMEITRGGGNIESVPKFTDFQLHVEFNIPQLPPEAKGQARGNSGVYLQGLYEIQVLDGWNNETYADGSCGAIYGQYPPRVNASKPPGTWQAYDVTYTAPRFDEKGQLVQMARATVYHNGILIHDNVEIKGATTASGNYDRTQAGPIMLQDHGNPVKYRNIWVKPLTSKDAKSRR